MRGKAWVQKRLPVRVSPLKGFMVSAMANETGLLRDSSHVAVLRGSCPLFTEGKGDQNAQCQERRKPQTDVFTTAHINGLTVLQTLFLNVDGLAKSRVHPSIPQGERLNASVSV
jgi:hypothetical protein